MRGSPTPMYEKPTTQARHSCKGKPMMNGPCCILIRQNRHSAIGLPGALGQHHDFSASLVLLHAPMRLNNLFKMENLSDLDMQRARRNLLN